jgi:sugar transferase (PEP-CTERM/EpsH1 system associated)
MNILLLSPWLPWPPHSGGRIRIFETLRYLSHQHSVTLVTSVYSAEDSRHAVALKDYCENIVTTVLANDTGAVLSRLSRGLFGRRPLIQSFYYDTRLAEQIRNLTSRIRYDIIQVEFPFLTPYLRAVAPHSRAKRILTMHNIESLRFERELRLSHWGKRRLVLLGDHLFFRAWEQQALRQFDGIITVSGSERTWVQRHAPRATVELIPNGVDTEYFSPAPTMALKSEPYVVFTGAMDYLPNVDAACWFCNEILPVLQRKIPNLGLKIVGKNPHGRLLKLDKRNGVQVTGTVEDIRGYVAGSVALVVPLRSGGGTRLKILEAMAMERPVISTTVGAEGLEVTPGADILIADDAQGFVTHVGLLLKSLKAAKNLGRAGRRLVVEKYDWRVCFDGLERLYGALLGSAAA